MFWDISRHSRIPKRAPGSIDGAIQVGPASCVLPLHVIAAFDPGRQGRMLRLILNLTTRPANATASPSAATACLVFGSLADSGATNAVSMPMALRTPNTLRFLLISLSGGVYHEPFHRKE
jgi:hypothetical protein